MVKAKNIMVVDDELGIRTLLSGVLTEEGFNVTLACDGLDSWNQMKEQSFDLVITDIDMPRLDGIELLRRMKKDHRKEKVLVITGHGMEYDDLRHEFPMVCCLLKKPFQMGFFLETVILVIASPGTVGRPTSLEFREENRETDAL